MVPNGEDAAASITEAFSLNIEGFLKNVFNTEVTVQFFPPVTVMKNVYARCYID